MYTKHYYFVSLLGLKLKSTIDDFINFFVWNATFDIIDDMNWVPFIRANPSFSESSILVRPNLSSIYWAGL